MSDPYKLIRTVDDLHFYLTQAMKIEHATIPPYMTALYSLKPGSNLEAFHIMRTVLVEEMLHLTLAANVFNAVGGDIQGVLTAPDFVPVYPTYLPTGADDFQVSIAPFSQNTVSTFLQIERSKEVEEGEPIVGPRPNPDPWLTIPGFESNYSYYSIGLFYAEIIRGMYQLYQELGDDLFSGDPAKQITAEYYYNGAGNIIPVTDWNSALAALQVIQEQGEGSRQGTIYDGERELCHYYRFQQLQLGQYYEIDKQNPLNSDQPGAPSGASFDVDWKSVYSILPNAKLSDYPAGSVLHNKALEFQQSYHGFLADIETAFNGQPQTLIPAVHDMFTLRELATQLMRNPVPGMPGVFAAPVFSNSDAQASRSVAESTNDFLALSETVTGFSQFDLEGTGQTLLYLNTVIEAVGNENYQALIQLYNDEGIEAVFNSETLAPIARNIIKLWYIATWDSLLDESNPADQTRIVAPEAYPEGLLWPTIGVNPPGAKAQGYAAWSHSPTVIRTLNIN
ncbi:MAG: ferritin-like protein [Reinekea sp.]|jgi:hypothetical protein